MSYVDGYILPIPKKQRESLSPHGGNGPRRVDEARRRSTTRRASATTWSPNGEPPFTRMMKLKPGETVVFAYVVFKSRAHRDRVNKKVMKEMNDMGGSKDMPFDAKRMVYGGFKTIVE